jgi:hypothetical protein
MSVFGLAITTTMGMGMTGSHGSVTMREKERERERDPRQSVTDGMLAECSKRMKE